MPSGPALALLTIDSMRSITADAALLCCWTDCGSRVPSPPPLCCSCRLKDCGSSVLLPPPPTPCCCCQLSNCGSSGGDPSLPPTRCCMPPCCCACCSCTPLLPLCDYCDAPPSKQMLTTCHIKQYICMTAVMGQNQVPCLRRLRHKPCTYNRTTTIHAVEVIGITPVRSHHDYTQ